MSHSSANPWKTRVPRPWLATWRGVATFFRIRPCAVVLAWAALSGSAMAALVEGSEPKDWPADPAMHVVNVRREAADGKQASMIAAAEAVMPSRETLRKAAGDEGAPEGVKIWWHREVNGIRIPCGITADAVTYFSELVTRFGKQTLKRYARPSSRLDYRATVAAHEEFERDGQTFKDVHVVRLKLTFSENFVMTQTEGMEFQKERVVILDAAGKVLHVSGDGPTEVAILAI